MKKYEDYQNEFIKNVEKLSYKYQTWKLFSDFCRISAIALYQPFKQSEELENEYLKIINEYDKETAYLFVELFSLVVKALSLKFGDFLGEVFMKLNLGSKFKGQFFTPYYISKFMNEIVGVDNNIETMADPCCGSGGMIIARAEILKDKGINYQNTMLVQVIDIDSLCVNMCYIHLSLLNIPAEVVHGNSLTLEVFSTWYTPGYFFRGAKLQNKNISKNEKIKVSVPLEIGKDKKALYTDEQLEVFLDGRLF